ncbi:MAG: hypothetical protein ACLPXB_04075 [Thiobacillaceae bacterium]
MNIKRATGVFIIDSLFAPMAAHPEQTEGHPSHPTKFAKDSGITSKIKAKPVAEKFKSLVSIKVDTGVRARWF